MKGFLLTVTQIAGGAFVLAGVVAFVNMATGWRLGIKGAAIPADPVFGLFMVALGGLVLGLLWFFATRHKPATGADA
ncbi:MAG: hypothetical protein KF889_10610 [Alphaproteobacteria bacterium]|nr:hypothetical protein [Alphaproteobacteria bacterium]MCW5741275.1 hypothetical protein [Alphaproteobacteria bacterium]